MTASRADEDSRLVERFLEGNLQAFNELMAAHEDRVFGICLRVMRDRELALDAVQETFITVYRKAGKFTGESAFSTWLYRVATNTCYDQLRKIKRRAAGPLPDTTDPADPHSDAAFTAVELRPDLQRALETLGPEFHKAIVLADMEALPLQQVAEILGVPVGTIKSRVFRARRQLAAALRNQNPDAQRRNGDNDA
jgi:RNA polymerase sigma-70 factor (ECF subfamily)